MAKLYVWIPASEKMKIIMQQLDILIGIDSNLSLACSRPILSSCHRTGKGLISMAFNTCKQKQCEGAVSIMELRGGGRGT